MAKFVRVTSPVGSASYPWLLDPDTKFDKDGIYSCNIYVDKGAAKDLVAKIDKAYDANIADTKTVTGKDKIKPGPKPYELGDDNRYLFKIKQKAKIGESSIRPTIVNAKGKQLTNISVYGGSEVKVAMDLVPYFVATTGAGITLRLIGVQILKLQEKPMPSLDTLGFKEEDGYDGEDAEVQQPKDKVEKSEASDDFI